MGMFDFFRNPRSGFEMKVERDLTKDYPIKLEREIKLELGLRKDYPIKLEEESEVKLEGGLMNNYPIDISSDEEEEQVEEPVIIQQTWNLFNDQRPIYQADISSDEEEEEEEQVEDPVLQQTGDLVNDERLIYQAALQDMNQPKTERDLPPGVLTVPLMRHQKIALEWMHLKEKKSMNCLGGILADDQGLGKTISMISLILLQKLKSESKPNKKARSRKSGGTLIVCPASIVKQWAREVQDKVSQQHKLSVLVYHGKNRSKNPVEVAKYDVVVTTYAIVTNEVPHSLELDNEVKSKKKKSDGRIYFGALARVRWLRVILDEAHTIKNYNTLAARSCTNLKAKRRWCLSGTPMQNEILDLYSYFKFLRYHPYAVKDSFRRTITTPLKQNPTNGYKKLQAILRAILLRRTKGTILDGKPILDLPPKILNLDKVDFSEKELSFYRTLETNSQEQFKEYANAGTVYQNYAHILVMLLRLRQACDHPQLTQAYVDNRNQELLALVKTEFISTKIKATMEILLQSRVKQEIPKTSSGTKTLVFSQWTGMLDLVEISLVKNGLSFRRLDGSMSLSERDKSVYEFNNDSSVQVMLLSLKAGNLGLNMVSANHVILLDLWWNPTTEDQAIDRAHRIGQTRTVTVNRITIKNTIEERILALQEKKREMVASAFGEDYGGVSGNQLTIEDLKYLFFG